MTWNTHIPKFRRFVLQNFPFIEEDFDALTDYGLICKVIEYLNTVITSQNEVVAEVESFETNITDDFNRLEDLFNDLKSFVDNYFDNLDVQEEINNKLEQMVEDGTLQDILLNYATVSKVYTTTREMLADADNILVGEKVRTLGYYNLNDGGGAEFVIESTTSSKYQITLDTDKYATMIATNVNVNQLGANGGNNALSVYFETLEDAQKVYPDATDLTQLVGGVAIQCAINYFHDHKISLSAGTYYVSENLSNKTANRIHLVGDEKWKSVIKRVGVPESEASVIYINSSASRCVFENLDIVGPYDATDTDQATLASYIVNGIFFNTSSYNTVKNCVFRQCRSGIKTAYSWTNLFVDCYFVRCNMGVGLEGSAQNCIEINHCFAEYCNYGLYLGEGRSQIIINCNVEHCNVKGIRKTNEGDIQILSSYFESSVELFYGQTYTRNALIYGCSFYQNSTNSDFYTPIVFSGNASGNTQVTIQNCNFIDGNSEADYSDHPAIMQLNNATTIPPVLINNTVTNMIEFRPTYMRGVHIKNGVINSYYKRTFAQNAINASDGGELALDYKTINDYRLNLMTSGTYTIKIPAVETSDRYTSQSFRMIVGPNNGTDKLGTISLTPVDSSTCEVAGHTSITLSDKNKIVTITYLGNWSNKDHWVASVSA